MKRTNQFVAIVIGIVVGAGVAHAGPGPGKGIGGFPPMQRMIRALELSPEQEQTIRGVIEEARPRFKALRESAGETRRALLSTNPDDPAYAATVAAASQASATHAADLVNLMSETRVQVYALLDADQKEKANELMATVQERGKRFQRRGWRGRKGCTESASPDA